jgi:outer membrane protein assembly factor BamE
VGHRLVAARQFSTAGRFPTEAEFAAGIDVRKSGPTKVPRLEATPQELQAFKPTQVPEPVLPAAPASMDYPPLESPAR